MPRWLWKIFVIFGIPRFGKTVKDLNTVSFPSRKCKKSVSISGEYFQSPMSDKCIIIVQGYSREWGDMEIGLPEIIKFLVKHGFNVLMLDLRARGQSGGRKVSLRYEVYDLLGARDFLASEKKIEAAKIGLLGFSYGAMVCILAASKDSFGAIVIDSAPFDITGFIKKTLKKFYLPSCFFKVAEYIMDYFFDINLKKSDIRKAVKKISAPIFIIYGRKDTYLFTSAKEIRPLKEGHPLDREWQTDATHSKSYMFHPKEYLEGVGEFFEKALKPTC